MMTPKHCLELLLLKDEAPYMQGKNLELKIGQESRIKECIEDMYKRYALGVDKDILIVDDGTDFEFNPVIAESSFEQTKPWGVPNLVVEDGHGMTVQEREVAKLDEMKEQCKVNNLTRSCP